MTHSTQNSTTKNNNLPSQSSLSPNNLSPTSFPQTQSFKTLLNHFKTWLTQKKLSPTSITNYLSDVRIFLRWLDHLPKSPADFHRYSTKLQSQNHKRNTINRKLASLRHFAKFLNQAYALPDMSQDFQNLEQDPISNLIKNFRHHLHKQGHKSKTIVNYLSDVRQYLAWAALKDKT